MNIYETCIISINNSMTTQELSISIYGYFIDEKVHMNDKGGGKINSLWVASYWNWRMINKISKQIKHSMEVAVIQMGLWR